MRKTTPMTYLLLTSFVLVFAVELWFQYQSAGLSYQVNTQVLFNLGANFSPAFAAGEYWRVLSSCFLHVDLLHLFMNGMAFFYFGPIIERSFGSFKLLLAFLLTGVMGALLTTYMHWGQNDYISAGASGGLYGLFGVMFVAGKRNKANLPKSFQTWLNQNFLLLIVFSFAPFIDKWGHFGGLGLGLILGWFYVSLSRQGFQPWPAPVPATEIHPVSAFSEPTEEIRSQASDDPSDTVRE